MRLFLCCVALGGAASAQSIAEAAAAIGGGAVGGVAGKQVSAGIDTIFGKVDQQTKKAAEAEPKSQDKGLKKSTSSLPVIQVSPGVPRPDSVPPPPPPKGKKVV